MTVGGGKLLNLPVPASTVFVADPTVADVQPPSASGVFVFGKKPGTTTLFALTHEGCPILAYTVVVEYDESVLHQAIADATPDLSVRLSRTPRGLLLQGMVPIAETAAHLEAIAQGYATSSEPVINQLQVAGATQVNLRVRVAEVSRTVPRQLGFNWNVVFRNLGSFAIGLQTGFPAGALSTVSNLSSMSGNAGSASTITGTVASHQATGQLAIDAMADEGLVTLLAEPNLTTNSGEPANFLAGGEYPIPVPQGLGGVVIQYKQYGVSVGFTPTVLSSGMISMKVGPEVSELSELSTDGSYAIAGSNSVVPALVTRPADTTVQLASGQSFAMGGLIQNNGQNNFQDTLAGRLADPRRIVPFNTVPAQRDRTRDRRDRLCRASERYTVGTANRCRAPDHRPGAFIPRSRGGASASPFRGGTNAPLTWRRRLHVRVGASACA